MQTIIINIIPNSSTPTFEQANSAFQFTNVWLGVNNFEDRDSIYTVEHLNRVEAKMLEAFGLSNQSFVEVWAPTCLNPENEFYPEFEHPKDDEVWIMIARHVSAPFTIKIIVPNVWKRA